MSCLSKIIPSGKPSGTCDSLEEQMFIFSFRKEHKLVLFDYNNFIFDNNNFIVSAE